MADNLGIAPVRVILIDDHEMFLEGMRIVLEATGEIDVVGVASDGLSGLELLRRRPVDVAVVDVHLPRTNVVSLISEIKATARSTKVLVLSGDVRAEVIGAVIDAGCDAYLSKDSSSRQVAAAVHRLALGQTGPYLTTASPKAARDSQVELLARSLSPRERHVLSLLVAGYSNRRIAEECFLSLNTVRTHVQNVLVKLGVHSKLEAAAFAVRHGLVADTPAPAGSQLAAGASGACNQV